MPMTISEKILAAAAEREGVAPGEIITAKIDVICVDEIQLPIFKETLEEMGAASIHRDRLVLVADHYCPPTTLAQAGAIKMLRDFAAAQNLDIMAGGIKHQLLMETGTIRPGFIVVATDSHINTCGALGSFAAAFGPSEAAMMAATGETWLRVPETIRCEIMGTFEPPLMPRDAGLHILGKRGLNFAGYKTIEFCGETVSTLNMDGRITLCNMSSEMGAKNGIIAVDAVSEKFLRSRNVNDYRMIAGDPDASYNEVLTLDVSKLEPMVAAPHSPANVRPVSEFIGTRLDQAFIGSCAGGNMEDLRAAAKILADRTVHPDTRLIITPASRETYLRANSEGLIDVFLRAKAIVSGMTCSVCIALEGQLLPGQTCISTSTRNFKGRMGSPDAFIFLASPATVAVSAIRGEITDPREFA